MRMPSSLLRRRAGEPAALGVVSLTFLLIVGFFYATMAWTILMSFTRSKMLPTYHLVGFEQYVRLFSTERWNVAFKNMFVFGIGMVVVALALGVLLAVLLDRNVRFEPALRTIFLYPMAMSFIVTGLAWQWMLSPGIGIQAFVRSFGWSGFSFDWLADPHLAVLTLVLAGVWHQAGLVMVIMLAGLGGVDREIWRAATLEGIPIYRTYLSIVLPTLKPLVTVCVILLLEVVVKSYDLVVALTGGGPGFASDLPARFVIDSTFERGNLGLACAGAVVMLVVVTTILVPYLSVQLRREGR